MMKKFLTLGLALIMALSISACTGKPREDSSRPQDSSQVQTVSLWDSAVYTEDVELGDKEAPYAAKVTVKAEGKSIVATLHGESDNLGDLLLETELVAGTEGEYGLYIDSVNGILADYDADGAYWAIYIGDEYASTGADGIALQEGTAGDYTLEYTVYTE